MSKYIRNWEELAAIPNESSTHILDVDINCGNGWLRAKQPRDYTDKLNFMRQAPHLNHYLSTHTFYGNTYKFSTKLLRVCGFDVELANWDAK